MGMNLKFPVGFPQMQRSTSDKDQFPRIDHPFGMHPHAATDEQSAVGSFDQTVSGESEQVWSLFHDLGIVSFF